MDPAAEYEEAAVPFSRSSRPRDGTLRLLHSRRAPHSGYGSAKGRRGSMRRRPRRAEGAPVVPPSAPLYCQDSPSRTLELPGPSSRDLPHPGIEHCVSHVSSSAGGFLPLVPPEVLFNKIGGCFLVRILRNFYCLVPCTYVETRFQRNSSYFR